MNKKNFLAVIRLLHNIVIKPIKTIKRVEIISYDRQYLRRIGLLITLFIGIFLNKYGDFVAPYREKPVKYVFILILTPIVYMFTLKAISFSYFLLIKYIARIKVSYVATEILFEPFIILIVIWRGVVTVLSYYIPKGSSLFGYMLTVWFIIQVFFIFKYKFAQSTTKSILITLIYPALDTTFAIIDHFVKG